MFLHYFLYVFLLLVTVIGSFKKMPSSQTQIFNLKAINPDIDIADYIDVKIDAQLGEKMIIISEKMNALKNDMDEMKNEMKDLKDEIKQNNNDMDEIKNEMKDLKNQMKKIDTKTDTNDTKIHDRLMDSKVKLTAAIIAFPFAFQIIYSSIVIFLKDYGWLK